MTKWEYYIHVPDPEDWNPPTRKKKELLKSLSEASKKPKAKRSKGDKRPQLDLDLEQLGMDGWELVSMTNSPISSNLYGSSISSFETQTGTGFFGQPKMQKHEYENPAETHYEQLTMFAFKRPITTD